MRSENVLEDLYYGNIAPSEKRFDRASDYAKHIEIISDSEEKLNDLLTGTEGGRQLFSDFINVQSEISGHNELEYFIEGFQLGAKFMLDTFLLPRKSVLSDIC